MNPENHTVQTVAVSEEARLPVVSTECGSETNPSHWDALDKALHLLIQREEWLLGDALAQCNELLEESLLQVEEIQEFLNDDE